MNNEVASLMNNEYFHCSFALQNTYFIKHKGLKPLLLLHLRTNPI